MVTLGRFNFRVPLRCSGRKESFDCNANSTIQKAEIARAASVSARCAICLSSEMQQLVKMLSRPPSLKLFLFNNFNTMCNK